MSHAIERIEAHQMFGGQQLRCRHTSSSLKCAMTFSIFLPPQYEQQAELPVLYWLSGLTCTDENFTHKAGAQRIAAELGLILVMPDTSPRGEGVPNDEGYDLGQGAGFYVNATQAPWSEHFKMFDYVAEELPSVIKANFKAGPKQSISGHSMGGHGAIMMALRHPLRYASVSAFAPIVNPADVPWGRKAFTAYLGSDESAWMAYDSCALLSSSGHKLPMLIDQGEADGFMPEQLQPQAFADIAKSHNWPITVRLQPGYDHSYYFIATFIEDHLRFHAQHLAK